MRVENLINDRGYRQANQFVIYDKDKTWFQSYRSVVACVSGTYPNIKLTLSADWDYSQTTVRALYKFLRDNWNSNADRKMIQAGLADGTIAYVDAHSIPGNAIV